MDGILKLSKILNRPVSALDLEATTGDLWDPAFGICEIGWVSAYPNGHIEEFSALIDPQAPMNWMAAKLTGISDEMLVGQPKFEELYPKIKALMEEHFIVGFGLHGLDMRALLYSMDRRALVRPNQWSSLDLRDAWVEFAGTPKGKLAEVCVNFGGDPGQAHRALDDARSCSVVTHGLLEKGSEWLMSFARERACQTQDPSEGDKRVLLESELKENFNRWLLTGSWDKFIEAAHDEQWGLTPKAGFIRWKKDGLNGYLKPRLSIDEAAQHLGPPPEWMIQNGPMMQAVSLMRQVGEPLSEAELARRLGLKNFSALAAARALLIETGELAPWSGVSDVDRDFAVKAFENWDAQTGRRGLIDGMREMGASKEGSSAAAASIIKINQRP